MRPFRALEPDRHLVPLPVSSLISSSCKGSASTNAVPSVGCPVNGISTFLGREDAHARVSVGFLRPKDEDRLRVVHLLCNGRCNIGSGISRASVKTASWFPGPGAYR